MQRKVTPKETVKVTLRESKKDVNYFEKQPSYKLSAIITALVITSLEEND